VGNQNVRHADTIALRGRRVISIPMRTARGELPTAPVATSTFSGRHRRAGVRGVAGIEEFVDCFDIERAREQEALAVVAVLVLERICHHQIASTLPRQPHTV